MSSAGAVAAEARRPMTVAIYMHDLTGGGVERQTIALARELRDSGVAVTLVLHQSRGPLQVPAGLAVCDLQSKDTVGDIPRLARFLRQRRPDILLANLDHNNVAALLAKAVAVSGTKVVICQHNQIGRDFASHERWTYRMIPLAYRVLSPLISRAVGVSEGVTGELRGLAHLPARKLQTIHNPVVGRDFGSRSEAAVEHPWFDQPGHPLFVTAGRMVAQKDHETLLRALALHRRHMPGRLLMLGSGPLQDHLERLAAELQIADAVQFLGFQDNPLPYLRRADCFVLSSVSEGFGNVLVEAMACGTPVISTDCRYGPREILDHGRFGALVPAQDAQALATAMDGLAELRARCPEALLRRRAEDFSLAACTARYLALFQRLCPDCRGAP
jgi:glycosyltransferase involved in cell wall biosynthesis